MQYISQSEKRRWRFLSQADFNEGWRQREQPGHRVSQPASDTDHTEQLFCVYKRAERVQPA